MNHGTTPRDSRGDNDLRDSINTTLLRSEHLQVFRVVLPKGEEFSDHAVAGEITVQCLEGSIEFRIGQTRSSGSLQAICCTWTGDNPTP